MIKPPLSICVPSNRTGLRACANLLQACSWGSHAVEVVIRDNSGSGAKKAIMGVMDKRYCRVVYAPPCDAATNLREVVNLSKGEFVVYLQDDDGGFNYGVQAASRMANRELIDPSVIGITGGYVVESDVGSSVGGYVGIDSHDPMERLAGYLSYQGPNLLFESAIRRHAVLRVLEFLWTAHPIPMPFHDQIAVLTHLLAGRFLQTGRLMFINDNSNWSTGEACVRSDIGHYTAAAMDPAIRRLHWMLCGFEGANVVLRTPFGAHLPEEARAALAGYWLESMYLRFSNEPGLTIESEHDPAARTLADKWKAAHPHFALYDMLADICDFIEKFNQPKAQAYFDFWSMGEKAPVGAESI